MRGPLALTGLAVAATIGCGAAAAEAPRQPAAKPRPALQVPVREPSASSGSSLVPRPAATTPEDAYSEQLRQEDERKATESKEKMRRRPGYKEEVPAPRA